MYQIIFFFFMTAFLAYFWPLKHRCMCVVKFDAAFAANITLVWLCGNRCSVMTVFLSKYATVSVWLTTTGPRLIMIISVVTCTSFL